MEYTAIDTETSGLFDFSKPADAPGQPRLCSMQLIRLNDQLEMVSEYHAYVRPDGWTLDPESDAAKLNGLTQDFLTVNGVPIDEVLDAYQGDVLSGRAIVAYNAQYDTKIMRAEFRLRGRDDLFERTPNICTMRALAALRIPKASGKSGNPKLSDAWRYFFPDDAQPQPHTAQGDAIACAGILRELVRRGICPPAQVHYAKNRPGESARSAGF